MPADNDLDPRSPSRSGLAITRAHDREIAPSGPELVELSERLYGGMFRVGLILVAVVALFALVLAPVRGATQGSAPADVAMFSAGLVVLGCTLAFWRARSLYRLLRRDPRVELLVVLAAVILVTIVDPEHMELWWPSCGLVALLAILAPIGRVLAYCAVLALTSATAMLLWGDPAHTRAEGFIGLVVGYPFWSATVALVTDRLAAHMLRLNATPPQATAPLRTPSWITPSSPRTPATTDRQHPEPTPPAACTSRLTARQLQVVALLAHGLRYAEVADSLLISVRQVERHIVNAIARLEVNGVNALVALAVAEGLVPCKDD